MAVPETVFYSWLPPNYNAAQNQSLYYNLWQKFLRPFLFTPNYWNEVSTGPLQFVCQVFPAVIKEAVELKGSTKRKHQGVPYWLVEF